jgi:hypothetical protein
MISFDCQVREKNLHHSGANLAKTVFSGFGEGKNNGEKHRKSV